MHLQVQLFTDLSELLAHSAEWDGLAGSIPFRCSAWISAWWRHYGAASAGRRRSQLYVPAVLEDSGRLVGLAPWCRRFSLTEGWILEWLGTGEVCSDYLGLLCADGSAEAVARTLADWLCHHSRDRDEGWDQMRTDAVDAQDRPTEQLIRALGARDCTIHRRVGPRCWRLGLPQHWDEYLERLSKSHRKQIRRLERNMLASGRAYVHSAQAPTELPAAFAILTDLHQRRRTSIGQEGRFASPRFAAFHRDVSTALAERGQCSMHWLEIDGQPAAAEYHFRGPGLSFAYQSGVDPGQLEHEPGNLITVALSKQAVERGDSAMDFLRGDEPYKPHFRAEPRPSLRYRIAAPGWRARCCLFGWTAARGIRNLLVEPEEV